MSNFAMSFQPARQRSPVTSAVAVAAQRSGVDFDFLIDVARVESNFDPAAQASTSSAHGLYQFTKQTWLATLHRHGHAQGLGWAADAIQRNSAGQFEVADPGARAAILELRGDPAASASMAAMLAADNRDLLVARTGAVPENVDLYLAHFLGAASAAKFLDAWQENPDQAAAPLLPAAAAANRSIFFGAAGAPRSLNEIRENFRAKLDAPHAAPSNATGTGPMPSVARSMAYRQRAGSEGLPLPMLEIRPMPQKLSLAFAADTYRRLAALDAPGRIG